MKPDGETLQVAVSYNLPSAYLGITLRLGEGLAGRVARTGAPLMVEDYGAWEGQAAVFADAPFRRVLGVPLKSGDTVIGVIMVDDDKPGSFCEDDVRLVGLFADQAALAVEKTRLYEAVQHELAERKRAEEMLQQRNRELAALNAELQARNEELDAFAHTVAHDLQNP
jgi:GAF domain-containing protein